jgi:hypothetical protein
MTTITIPARYNGPPGSGNGGYSCGAIAEAIGEPVEVTLRRPPPLDTPLRLVATDEGWSVLDGDALIADAAPAGDLGDAPTPPTADEAAAAMRRYLGLIRHEFPRCFTCGPGRDDGLRIFSGPIGDGALVAAEWIPDDSLPATGDAVTVPIVWAALDCPGAWTAMRTNTDAAVVLGRMAAQIERLPSIGERLVSYAWRIGGEGRKAYAGTALADGDGTVIAQAKQTWIAIE